MNFTPVQCTVGIGLAILLAIGLVTGWAEALQARRDLRQAEREAAVARKQAKEALQAAADIGRRMQAVREQLIALEEKRSEKLEKYARVSRDARDLSAEYDRARRERAADASLGQLCQELAELGYPCDR